MRQRVMIATALACEPRLLIADEPTTGLDVTIQDQVLKLLTELSEELGVSVLMITHDLGVVAEFCDRVQVMYAGRIVERAHVRPLFASPQHPYTKGLINSVPRIDLTVDRLIDIAGEPFDRNSRPKGCAFASALLLDVGPMSRGGAPSGGVRRQALGGVLQPERTGRAVTRGKEADVTVVERSSAQRVEVPIVRTKDLAVHFTRWVGSRRRTVRAVDDFTIEVRAGETLGLVGESGCGKSTVGRTLLGAIKPTSGRIEFRGIDVTDSNSKAWRALRRDMQLVFQDPYSALNPKMTVKEIISEPFIVHGVSKKAELQHEVDKLLDLVGLPRTSARKYPHAFSGGQRQRIVIARALALRPAFVVADEATSALDVSIQAQIVNLMQELQRELHLSYLFISHNLAVVRHISDRVAIMYLGRVVEIGTKDQIYSDARHPYTQALLSAVPTPDPTVTKSAHVLEGDIPSAMNPPAGCRFHTRCPLAMEQCRTVTPELTERDSGHLVACWVN